MSSDTVASLLARICWAKITFLALFSHALPDFGDVQSLCAPPSSVSFLWSFFLLMPKRESLTPAWQWNIGCKKENRKTSSLYLDGKNENQHYESKQTILEIKSFFRSKKEKTSRKHRSIFTLLFWFPFHSASMNRSAQSIIPNKMNDNTNSTMNTGSTFIDHSTRICRRITFLYANDMTNNSDTIATTFQYLQQSSVPFHQSAYTIHEYTCGDNSHVSASSTAPKLVATTPISSTTSA